MAASINYASTPTSGSGTLTTGDTSRTAPTNTVTFFTPSNGTSNLGGMCERIVIVPVASTVGSVIRIFKYDGTNYHPYYEQQIGTVTVSGSSAVQVVTLEAVDNPNLFPIMVPAGWTLRASVNDSQTGVSIAGEGGSF